MSDVDGYLWNVRDCFIDAVRILERAGRREVVDEVLLRPTPESLARCIRTARLLTTEEMERENLSGDFSALVWDSDVGFIAHPDGGAVAMRCTRRTAVWDNSWMYEIAFCRGQDEDGCADTILKLTPAATVEAYRSMRTPPPPSETALKLLGLLGLSPELSTVIDWGATGADPDDVVESLLVVPPAELPGAHSYRIRVNHTGRRYSVDTSGGIGGGGSLYSRDFDDDW
jgi:hypothetical protein